MPVSLLTIPDIRQREDYDCGAACVAALLSFHGRRWPAVWSLPNPVQGLAPDTVEAVLRAAGLSVASGSMRLADLRHYADSDRPVMCPVALHGGHWVIVRGVSARRVYYHCPTAGPTWVGARDWREVWHDTSRGGTSYPSYGIVASP